MRDQSVSPGVLPWAWQATIAAWGVEATLSAKRAHLLQPASLCDTLAPFGPGLASSQSRSEPVQRPATAVSRRPAGVAFVQMLATSRILKKVPNLSLRQRWKSAGKYVSPLPSSGSLTGEALA
jgi:hypothetical protein